VDRYGTELCREGREVINFGSFKDEAIQVLLSGFVECWGDGENDLCGEGTLEILFAPHVRQTIRVVVLGSILGTGTAVLLDDQFRIWFYHTPNSVDHHLEGMTAQVALVMLPVDGMRIDTEIKFLAEYNNVRVQVKEVESDEE
jgi:hypothetical protein